MMIRRETYDELKNLQDEKHELEFQLRASEHERLFLTEKLNSYSDLSHDIKINLLETENELFHVSNQFETTNTELELLKRQLEHAKRRNDLLRSELFNQEAENDILRDVNDGISRKTVSGNQKIAALQDELHFVQGQLDEMDESKNASFAKVSPRSPRELEMAEMSLSNELCSLQLKLENERNCFSIEIKKHEENTEELRKIIQLVKSENSSLKSVLEEKEAEISHLIIKSSKSNFNSPIKMGGLSGEITTSHPPLSPNQTRASHALTLARLTAENEELKQTSESLRLELERRQEETSRVAQEFADIRRSIEIKLGDLTPSANNQSAMDMREGEFLKLRQELKETRASREVAILDLKTLAEESRLHVLSLLNEKNEFIQSIKAFVGMNQCASDLMNNKMQLNIEQDDIFAFTKLLMSLFADAIVEQQNEIIELRDQLNKRLVGIKRNAMSSKMVGSGSCSREISQHTQTDDSNLYNLTLSKGASFDALKTISELKAKIAHLENMKNKSASRIKNLENELQIAHRRNQVNSINSNLTNSNNEKHDKWEFLKPQFPKPTPSPLGNKLSNHSKDGLSPPNFGSRNTPDGVGIPSPSTKNPKHISRHPTLAAQKSLDLTATRLSPSPKRLQPKPSNGQQFDKINGLPGVLKNGSLNADKQHDFNEGIKPFNLLEVSSVSSNLSRNTSFIQVDGPNSSRRLVYSWPPVANSCSVASCEPCEPIPKSPTRQLPLQRTVESPVSYHASRMQMHANHANNVHPIHSLSVFTPDRPTQSSKRLTAEPNRPLACASPSTPAAVSARETALLYSEPSIEFSPLRSSRSRFGFINLLQKDSQNDSIKGDTDSKENNSKKSVVTFTRDTQKWKNDTKHQADKIFGSKGIDSENDLNKKTTSKAVVSSIQKSSEGKKLNDTIDESLFINSEDRKNTFSVDAEPNKELSNNEVGDTTKILERQLAKMALMVEKLTNHVMNVSDTANDKVSKNNKENNNNSRKQDIEIPDHRNIFPYESHQSNHGNKNIQNISHSKDIINYPVSNYYAGGANSSIHLLKLNHHTSNPQEETNSNETQTMDLNMKTPRLSSFYQPNTQQSRTLLKPTQTQPVLPTVQKSPVFSLRAPENHQKFDEIIQPVPLPQRTGSAPLPARIALPSAPAVPFSPRVGADAPPVIHLHVDVNVRSPNSSANSMLPSFVNKRSEHDNTTYAFFGNHNAKKPHYGSSDGKSVAVSLPNSSVENLLEEFLMDPAMTTRRWAAQTPYQSYTHNYVSETSRKSPATPSYHVKTPKSLVRGVSKYSDGYVFQPSISSFKQSNSRNAMSQDSDELIETARRLVEKSKRVLETE